VQNFFCTPRAFPVGKRSGSYGDEKFCARLPLIYPPFGHHSRCTTAALKLFEATSSSCTVLPCIDTSAIMLRKLRDFKGTQ
jgi:hypothetical protein